MVIRISYTNLQPQRGEVCRAAEKDIRYHRVDFSSKLAHEARLAFVKNISRGEALVDLSLAALQICSEDDAISTLKLFFFVRNAFVVSNSPVLFPIQSYTKRMKGLSKSVANRLILQQDLTPQDSITIIEETFFNTLCFTSPSWGSSNLPERSIVDHPGVWEDQRYGYLHELLITKCGIPSLLTILYQHIFKLLLHEGTIDFAASFNYKTSSGVPKARLVPGLSRKSLIQSDGSVLNTCSMDCLFNVLYYLKRSFWPFAWDTNYHRHGGFKQGCENVLSGGTNAEIEAVSRSAQHRLSRGIWTTTGGGDVSRALSACERLVLLNGPKNHLDRRDLGLLYFYLGRFPEAEAELAAFERRENDIIDQDLEARRLTQQLLEQIQSEGQRLVKTSALSKMQLRLLFLLLAFTTSTLVTAKPDEFVSSYNETYADPCSCALLNFWDITPREDASTCCEALQDICFGHNSTLHCGHVYRFCLKRRAGYSAYILDQFVRQELKGKNCDAFNPRATHESERCGEGFCRIGYQCAEVNAEKCFSDGGLVCGDGYCNNGAECAEMSSQVCRRFKKENMNKKKLRGFDEPQCNNRVCEACKTITEYKCAFKKGMAEPCKTRGCARGRRCVKEKEEVCVVRQDAAAYINGETTHEPEKVRKRFRRFTAVIVPVASSIAALISVIAFISWATIRVRKARKEVGFPDDDSDEDSPTHDNSAIDKSAAKASRREEEAPLTPNSLKPASFARNAANLAHSVADILSPRLRLSVSGSPKHEDGYTPRSSSRTPPRGARLFTPKNYDSLEQSDPSSEDLVPQLQNNINQDE
eukprot:g7339.t1